MSGTIICNYTDYAISSHHRGYDKVARRPRSDIIFMSGSWPWAIPRAKLVAPPLLHRHSEVGSALHDEGSSSSRSTDTAGNQSSRQRACDMRAMNKKPFKRDDNTVVKSKPQGRKKRERTDSDGSPFVQAQQPAPEEPASASGADDMDDIFGELSAKKSAARELAEAKRREEQEAASRATASHRDAKKRRSKVKDPVFGEEYDPAARVDPMNARVHRFDNASGLNVFKAHALGLGRGGGTRLCPFDCDCCF